MEIKTKGVFRPHFVANRIGGIGKTKSPVTVATMIKSISPGFIPVFSSKPFTASAHISEVAQPGVRRFQRFADTVKELDKFIHSGCPFLRYLLVSLVCDIAIAAGKLQA